MVTAQLTEVQSTEVQSTEAHSTEDHLAKDQLHFVCLHLKHRKREPDGVHAWQIEGCYRNLRPKVAVAKVYTHVRPTGFSVDWAVTCHISIRDYQNGVSF